MAFHTPGQPAKGMSVCHSSADEANGSGVEKVMVMLSVCALAKQIAIHLSHLFSALPNLLAIIACPS